MMVIADGLLNRVYEILFLLCGYFEHGDAVHVMERFSIPNQMIYFRTRVDFFYILLAVIFFFFHYIGFISDISGIRKPNFYADFFVDHPETNLETGYKITKLKMCPGFNVSSTLNRSHGYIGDKFYIFVYR